MTDQPPQASAPRRKDALILRVASAAALAPAAIGATWLGGPIFVGLIAFLCILMIFEWSRMIERAEMTPTLFALAAGGVIALILAASERYGAAYAVTAASGVAAALATRRGAGLAGWAMLGAAYVIAPSIALIWLRENADYGRGFVLLLFAIVWAADTGGYIGGRLVGGPKLSPTISPAKTWAGAVGGVIMGALAAAIFAPFFFGQSPDIGHIAMGAGLGLASIFGDIAESACKRRFGLKDMSGFIPGHGGVLDRLDGMIFATVAVTAALYGHILAAGFGS